MMTLFDLLISALGGLLATLLMDRIAMALVRAQIFTPGPYLVVPRLLGRWILGFREGRFIRPRIMAEASVETEVPVGMSTHYLIGAVLGAQYGILCRALSWNPAEPCTAILFGTLTTVLPWFVMFPAMGFGVIARHVPAETRIRTFSLVNHIVYGIGLAAFFFATSHLVAAGR